MRVILCLLISALCVLADNKNGTNRRTKPFIADAVGNTLPPPSNMPATVGSPISLLSPDKYEFYTFDESGELVKRLMTLAEIQAIVAAGEDTDGLVTFANDNLPTIALNFSQAPYTKVHSVVTNVQNVLKAQMEAHKNKPLVQPTLDTPDVSDTWSLILPSIFGNSGVDVVPEKTTNTFTPETETIENNLNNDDSDNSLSKEGDNQISSSTNESENSNESFTTHGESVKTTVASSTTTTTTVKPTTTKKLTTKPKPLVTTTIRNKLVTTTRPRTTTTQRPSTTRSSTIRVTPTTTKPTTTTTTTKPTTPKVTTTKRPVTTTKKQPTTTTTETPITKEYISNDIPTAKPVAEFEKLSTFIPLSTVKYVTERTTQKPTEITKAPFVYAPTTKRSPTTTTTSSQLISSTGTPKVETTMKTPTISTNTFYAASVTINPDLDKINHTTITTQSVSPSTTVSSTEFLSPEVQPNFSNQDMKDDDPVLPLFDIAQSISQITSDLGNNYQPIPTSSNILDSSKITGANMESKEDLDMDIPSEENKNKNEDNFVKISTIDPHPPKKTDEKNKDLTNKQSQVKPTTEQSQVKTTTETLTTTEHIDLTTLTSLLSEGTTIDPILTESMEDLLSQVVNEAPQLDSADFERVSTTEKNFETTTFTSTDIPEIFISKTTTKIRENLELGDTKNDNEIPTIENVTTTKDAFVEVITEKLTTAKPTTEKLVEISTTEKTTSKKNSTKIISHSSNKVDSENKKDDKDEKDFIKISGSDSSNLSTQQTTPKTEVVKLGENDNPPSKNTEAHKQNDEEINTEKAQNFTTESVSTTTAKIEVTRKPIKFTNTKNKPAIIIPLNENTLSVGDKSNSNSKKDKIPDNLPKVEEFKKKIQKVNDEELANDRNEPWKLIPTVTPPKGNDISKEKNQPDVMPNTNNDENKNVLLDFSKENQGLEVTTKDLGEDIAQFTELCNELAFRYWNKIVENIDKKRSFVLSPYSITSMLAMMFMGAKGATSGEMNEILKLDDMVTFNPHFTLKNISDSIDQATNSGIAVSAFVRELFSDRTKGKILTFYKERAQHFYSGHVEEINFKLISDIIRRRTNLLVKKHTWGKIPEFMKTNNIVMKPPLAAFSTNIFQTDCTGTSVEGRDGEMYFVVSPNVRQRRLVPVPAVVYKGGFLAGYDPVLDATAAALGNTNTIVSTIFLMPGQQGNIVHAEDLEKLEQRLLDADPATSSWSRILRSLLPRVGLELQIPRFSHKSVFNVSSTLREMGLKELFDADHADLGGLNGPSKDLYLSDMIQLTSFVTCGEGLVDEQHHIEEYPETLSVSRRRTSRWADWDEPRDYQRAFHDPHDVGEAMHLPLHLRPRQARVPSRSVQVARLKFDRPFLFFVRHNPSGMILYVGRYNPRLLP